jgi:hypothetical protein
MWLRGFEAMRAELDWSELFWKPSGEVGNIVIVDVDWTIGGSTSAIGKKAGGVGKVVVW